jgi:microcystin degradation protein MlrC
VESLPVRVGIVALLQETNTFIERVTELSDFDHDLLATGEEVRVLLEDAHHEVGGFFHGLGAENLEAVPIFAARALPFGVVSRNAYRSLVEEMLAGLEKSGGVDALLVAPHGAMVAEGAPDADGDWLSRLRKEVGPTVPIVGTIDPHANVSDLMIESTDALIAYRSNPHLDQRATGARAARLLASTLRGEVRPTQALARASTIIGIERQATDEPPLRDIVTAADRMAERAGVLSDSVVIGFPYADVSEMGAGAIVVTDGDESAARSLARELADEVWIRRRELIGSGVTIAEALDRAELLDGPVCLLDMGDNVGGGSPGDSTFLARAIYERGIAPAFVCLADPPAARAAREAGVGKRLQLGLGGKTDDRHGDPLVDTFEVLGLHDGRFEEPEPRHGGIVSFDQGPTAIVRCDRGLTVMLTTRRMAPFSLRQLTAFEVVPQAFRVIVAKGVHSPVAAYAPVSEQLIRVDTPGVTTADVRRLGHVHRRKPLFPFEDAGDGS